MVSIPLNFAGIVAKLLLNSYLGKKVNQNSKATKIEKRIIGEIM